MLGEDPRHPIRALGVHAVGMVFVFRHTHVVYQRSPISGFREIGFGDQFVNSTLKLCDDLWRLGREIPADRETLWTVLGCAELNVRPGIENHILFYPLIH